MVMAIDLRSREYAEIRNMVLPSFGGQISFGSQLAEAPYLKAGFVPTRQVLLPTVLCSAEAIDLPEEIRVTVRPWAP
jgi:hypothetical protein